MSTSLTLNKEIYEASFRALEQNINGAKASPIHALRKDGFQKFIKNGLPSTKNEDWKYTDLTEISRTEFKVSNSKPVTASEIEKFLPNISDGHVVFFVDGKLSNELSNLDLSKGLTISSLSNILHKGEQPCSTFGKIADLDENPLVAFNTSFFEDGALIKINKDVVVEKPIYTIFVTSNSENSASYPRVFVDLETQSSATLIEIHLGLSNNVSLSSSVVEVSIAENAKLDHLKLGVHGENTSHLGHTAVNIQRDGYYRSNCITFNGKLVRNEISPKLMGENIECHLNGLTVIAGNQHVDNHTVLDHVKPHCHSNELYKGIYNGNSSGVFSGTIIVRPDAQKTDAIQSNQSLLLSKTASIETRPQLKIWADDVKCTHGATVGQLDEDALFYLRARGISEADAKKILVEAFAKEVLISLPKSEITSFIEGNLLEVL